MGTALDHGFHGPNCEEHWLNRDLGDYRSISAEIPMTNMLNNVEICSDIIKYRKRSW